MAEDGNPIVRRVVTGIDATGKSIIASDGAPENHYAMRTAPGFSRSILWSSPSPPVVPATGARAAALTDLHPKVGETVCLLLTLPPDGVMLQDAFDPEAFAAEGLAHNYGIFDKMEPDAPGFHTTDTIDCVMLIEGELWLETDDGHETRIGPGDCVVQTGTRHAWRNKSDRPAKMFGVLVGARREP